MPYNIKPRVDPPLLTTLSYSAGVQSHALLEMVLLGILPKPDNFLVLNADPGMEDSRSYEFVETTKLRCKERGIDFITASGPNLYNDLTSLDKISRVDNPPYWTKNKETGKIGKLQQNCTRHYKIRPMQKALRQYMLEKFGISLGNRYPPTVETWIGFAADEKNRCSINKTKYIKIRYPLIEMELDRYKIEGFYLQNNIEKPPRSVCNACFANGLAYFEDMFLNRPEDWDKAVKIDESIRDMTKFGIKDEVFVSYSCIPLKDMPNLKFKKFDNNYIEHRCNKGSCFL